MRSTARAGISDRIRSLALIAMAVCASARLVALVVQQPPEASPPIEPTTTVDSRLAGGQRVGHSIVLAAGQFATIVVAHRNIDVIVRLLEAGSPSDHEIAADGPTGELRLHIHATRSGRHALEIAAAYPTGAAGGYTIGVERVEEATPANRALAEAQRLHTRASRLQSNAEYAAALSHAEEAVTLREAALGPFAPDVARSLLLLAQVNDRLAKYAAADRLYLRAREIVDRSPERNELVAAAILDSRAANHIARARFREAKALASDALDIRQRMLGPDHVLVAASLGTLADLHHENANVQDARLNAERALEIASKTYRPTDLALGEFVDRVARAHLASGQYRRAEQLYRESLATRETIAGPESLAAADSIGGSARAALLSHDNVTAERLHRQSLAIRQKALGPDHPSVANDLFNLGLIRYRRRDYAAALELYSRALAIREKAFGGVHPSIPVTLNNFGLVYWQQGDYTRAEEFYQRSLGISEQLFGPESLRVANSLANLGIVAKETGHYTLAETRYLRALAIKERHLGPRHPDLVPIVESLAILYRDRGDYSRAEEWFLRVLEITEAALGPNHPIVARHLANLGDAHWAVGRRERAVAARRRALEIEEANLPLNLAMGSERQKLAYFEPMLRNLDETISLHLQRAADHKEARDLAVTTLLQRKGRVLDALADNLNAFRQRSIPDDRALLDAFSRVTADLAAAVLGESTQTSADRRRNAPALAAERERLEIEIQRRSAGYVTPSRSLTLDEVQSAVPPVAALLEFAVYRPFDPRAALESDERFGAPRYAVYVVRHGGETQWKDLGPTDEIDRSVDAFRSALADPTRPGIMSLAAKLHRQVMTPLEPLVGDARHLVISPDGPLNLIPFEALRGPEGRYLLEDFMVSYVTTGRDLVRMRAARPAATRAMVFADPAFGEPAGPPIAAAAAPAGTPAGRRRSVNVAQELSSLYFAPLAGTASEAQRIHALFPESDLRMGAAASERALKSLQAPRILHIATHGFFLQDSPLLQTRATGETTPVPDAARPIDNPLLRSGLALANANLPRSGSDDGILTALEAANLNLWGTKLVTLSACDTGVGVVRNGEGVYGLRRAFFLAGAESLVMSLWPVSDLITREIMTGYYAGLKSGLGRGAALRRMQLAILKRKGRAHPFYWASFIQAGEWAGLDGQR